MDEHVHPNAKVEGRQVDRPQPAAAAVSSAAYEPKGLVGRRDGPLAKGGAVACFLERGGEEEEGEREGGDEERG